LREGSAESFAISLLILAFSGLFAVDQLTEMEMTASSVMA
jgi:hypothetical protein